MTSLSQPNRKGVVTLETGIEYPKSVVIPFVDTSSGKVTTNSILIPIWTIADLLEPCCQTLRVVLKNANIKRENLKLVDVYFSALHRKSEAITVTQAIYILDRYDEYRLSTSTSIRIARTLGRQLRQSAFIAAVNKEIESRERGISHVATGAISSNVFTGKYSFKPIETAAWDLPNISKKYKKNPIQAKEHIESCRPSEPVRTMGTVGKAPKSKKNVQMLRLSGSLHESQKAKCIKKAKRISKVLNKKAA